MRTSKGARAGQYLALLGYLVFLAFPFLWLISTAFKPPRELASLHPTWIPKDPTLANFRQAFDEQPLLQAAFNSLIAALGAAVIAVLIATPMAYVMARHRTRLAKAATGWVVVSQAFPFVLVIIPLFLVLKNLRLINSLPGLIMVYVVWALPFALWMLVGYVRAVPTELEEAAAVDGAGRLRTLVSITAPLLAPGIVATALFAFISAWNEFFFALVLLKTPEKQTLPVVLTHFIGAEGVADLGPARRRGVPRDPALAGRLRDHPEADHGRDARRGGEELMRYATGLRRAGRRRCCSRPAPRRRRQFADGRITLRFQSLAWQEESVDANKELVKEWNAAHPDVKVEYVQGSWDSVHDQLLTSFEGGEAPDIIHDASDDLADFAYGGYLADLRELLPERLKSDIPQRSWETATFGDGVYGVPFLQEPRVLIANAKWLRSRASGFRRRRSPGPGRSSRLDRRRS